ncbi:DUF4097 family beta strand repeat-containing protein [Clostridium tunisiense]|uniref:DUF4097 family beta strand repeat-containing protein n=1 Tax=Clostridium tunisiense TaxID=219748 RepID=UPI0002FA9D55|nr:DUF4097 family beta strand repeat-containing protein [Clostridium tunisiense]
MFRTSKIKSVIIILLAIMFLTYGIGYYMLYKSSNETELSDMFKGLNNVNINLDNTFNLGNAKAYDIDETKSQAIDETELIDINLVSGNISLIPYDGKDIKATLKGSFKIASNDLPHLQVQSSGKTVTIRFLKDNGSLNSISVSDDFKLDVYIPKIYNKNLSVKSVSANITGDNLNVNKVTASSVSGKVNLSNISSTDSKFNSVSGNITIDSLTNTSASISSISGDIKVADFMGNLEGKTVSGNLNISYKNFQENTIEFKSTSGKLIISLPNSPSFYVSSTSTSGDMDIVFPVTVNNSSKKNITGFVGNSNTKGKINLSTVSGDIDIYKK